MSHRTDVIVVGAGPVGLVTSLLLARQGHHVHLVERWSAPYPLPRAIGLSHESMRILYWAGASAKLQSALEWDERYMSAEFVSSSGETLLKAPFRTRAESGWPEMCGFNQPDVEALLEELIHSHPNIRFDRGLAVTAVRQDADAAELTVQAADPSGRVKPDAPEQVLRAAYVVGCDGANSTVRECLGLARVDLGFAYDWLVVDIQPTRDRVWKPFIGQALGPARPVTWAPAGPGRRRFEFMLMPGESRDAMSTPESTWRLLAEQGVTPDDATLVRHAMYTFRAMWAEQWRQGRVLLAGDAAHLTPPFLAQGLNAGMRDAATLAWRLDLVLRGRAAAATLDHYTTERVPHARDLIVQAVELGKMICMIDPQACAGRDAALRANPSIPSAHPAWRLGPGALRADDPHAGLLGRQGLVEFEGRRSNFDDVCGVGRFVLLARQGNPASVLSSAARAAWDRLDGISQQVGSQGPVRDTEGVYTAWFDELDCEVLLLRPDFYIYGTGRSLQDADGLVLQLAGQLQMPAALSH